VATLALAVIGATAPAASAEGGANSTIKLKKLTFSGAAGVVTSGRASCIGKRKVSLFRYEGFVTDKVGITHTNGKGKWRVDKSLKSGRYFAKVDATKGCRYDNSKTKRLG
jgi:hypothetical protein